MALAQEAARLNGVAECLSLRRGHAIAEMERLVAAGERFELVICDPPPSSNRSASSPRGPRAIARWHALQPSSRVLRPSSFSPPAPTTWRRSASPRRYAAAWPTRPHRTHPPECRCRPRPSRASLPARVRLSQGAGAAARLRAVGGAALQLSPHCEPDEVADAARRGAKDFPSCVVHAASTV